MHPLIHEGWDRLSQLKRFTRVTRYQHGGVDGTLRGHVTLKESSATELILTEQ